MLQPVFLNTPNLVVNWKDACGLLVRVWLQIRASALLRKSHKIQQDSLLVQTWLLQVNV
jgi:hypothetical protein